MTRQLGNNDDNDSMMMMLLLLPCWSAAKLSSSCRTSAHLVSSMARKTTCAKWLLLLFVVKIMHKTLHNKTNRDGRQQAGERGRPGVEGKVQLCYTNFYQKIKQRQTSGKQWRSRWQICPLTLLPQYRPLAKFSQITLNIYPGCGVGMAALQLDWHRGPAACGSVAVWCYVWPDFCLCPFYVLLVWHISDTFLARSTLQQYFIWLHEKVFIRSEFDIKIQFLFLRARCKHKFWMQQSNKTGAT